ncbi:MAG: FimD/PapC N-terminal domain-containing protein, partial [Enterobacter roggenkampii]|nr:FimD/PapC N-terminal domain-containing protein [Enterobacter roggenkampii]
MLFKRSLLCLAISAALPFYACAENIASADTQPDDEEAIEFNDQFLLNGSSNIDINRFAHGNPVLPGTYRTKINLNGKLKSTVDVTFKDKEGANKQVISSQADSLIKISRIWADFFPANTS